MQLMDTQKYNNNTTKKYVELEIFAVSKWVLTSAC
jgi:hypothetical protein